MKRKTRTPLQLLAISGLVGVVVAGCGGGDGGGGQSPIFPLPTVAPATADPAPPPVVDPEAPQPSRTARCAVDTTVPASYEERRLPNKLLPSDALSFSEQLLKASGFDKFGPAFAETLCKDGLSGAASYDEAVVLLRREGQKLWQAALDRVQGRVVEGPLSKSDDRMRYWARLTMTKALRQWRPDFTLDEGQRAALEREFERASRGQYAIDFPEGPGVKRILVSGFDPFTLGNPDAVSNSNVRIGNPSGATILSLDGATRTLPDGSKAVIRTFILPVNYGPFMEGMQEDTLGPWFKPGPKRVDASITMSQGRDAFDLEHFNGRYHLATIPGNDDTYPPCKEAGGYPAAADCDIHPTARWMGHESKPWLRDSPPQFTQASLPFQKMIDAQTGQGIVNPATKKTGGWGVRRNDQYSIRLCTKAAADSQALQEENDLRTKPLKDAFEAAWAVATTVSERMRILEDYKKAVAALNLPVVPEISPIETNCAFSGSGGTYLSNESAYRNTLLRDFYRLQIPAGHIHTPVMTMFGAGSGGAITDATFESYRDAIVAQSRNLVFAVAETLTSSTAP